jgi:hypothetical protein
MEGVVTVRQVPSQELPGVLASLDPDDQLRLVAVRCARPRRWARRGSNPRPTDYESAALTG